MNIFKTLIKLFKPIDNFREELENKLADILQKLDENSSVDSAEKELIKEGCKALVSHYTDKEIPDTAYDIVAEEVVKCLGKVNQKLQTQLRK